MKKRFLMLFMMLLLSALVVTAAGYAWFTASSEASINGTQVRAETQGVLKVWTAGQNAPANQYSNYTTYIDFSDVDDPFYNPQYTDYAMKDQSGNGSLFYQTEADGVADKYSTVAGRGVALVYDLYFSAYSGNPAPNQTRDVYLSEMTITDVDSGELSESIRIGFLDASNNVFGVFNPNQTAWNKFVTTADYNGGAGKPADGDPSGTIIPSTSYEPVVAQTKYIAPVAGSETSVREIQVDTTICQIDAGEDACPGTDLLRVVIWIEGSDPNTLDDKLADSVSIDMVFEARIPADSYSLITYQNGAGVIEDNPEIIAATDFDEDNDGDGAGEETTAYYLNAATRDGYTFGGWYSNAALTTAVPTCTVGVTTYYVITTAYFTNQIANIYAKWTAE